jgi:hypothetical protein
MRYMVVAGALCAGFFAAPVQAAEKSNADGTNLCVRLSSITDERVIDDQTILINQGGGKYTRVDLAAPCPGLSGGGRGFTHDTALTNEFCTTDRIRINEPAGTTCIIRQFTSISSAEAKDLRTKK